MPRVSIWSENWVNFSFLSLPAGVHVMFLADNMRTAFIKQRRSLLPFRGLQQYLEYRTELLSKEVRSSVPVHYNDRRRLTKIHHLHSH